MEIQGRHAPGPRPRTRTGHNRSGSDRLSGRSSHSDRRHSRIARTTVRIADRPSKIRPIIFAIDREAVKLRNGFISEGERRLKTNGSRIGRAKRPIGSGDDTRLTSPPVRSPHTHTAAHTHTRSHTRGEGEGGGNGVSGTVRAQLMQPPAGTHGTNLSQHALLLVLVLHTDRAADPPLRKTSQSIIIIKLTVFVYCRCLVGGAASFSYGHSTTCGAAAGLGVRAALWTVVLGY